LALRDQDTVDHDRKWRVFGAGCGMRLSGRVQPVRSLM